MTKKRKIIDAKADKDGNINYVKLEGNQKYTNIETAIEMTKAGQVDAVAITGGKAKDHLRSRADGVKSNNLDHMADDE